MPASSLRVVHLATSLQGGAGIATRRILAAQWDAGIDARVVVAVAPTPADPDRVAVAARRQVPLWARALRRLGLWSSPRQRWLDRVARLPADSIEVFSPPHADFAPERHPWFQSADVIHIHWTSALIDWPALARGWRPGLRAILTLHDQEPYLGCFHYEGDRERNPSLFPLDQRSRNIKRSTYARLEPLVAGNSEWNTNRARASGIFPANTRWSTIPYPLDSDVFRPGDRLAARHQLGLGDHPPVIGFACDLLDAPRKGLRQLLAALARLPTELPVHLLSFGRNPAPAMRNEIHLPWTHLGPLADSNRQRLAYQAMDVMVVPSQEEAFGQTAIEALACETPVVATDVGGLREALFGGAAGELVPAADTGALAEALARVLRDPTPAREKARHGRQWVRRRHAPAINAAAHLDLYSN